MFNTKAQLFSVTERQDLVTQARREAGARMVRTLVRLKLAADLASSQEKVRAAEERALHPRRTIVPRQGLWQRVLSVVGGTTPTALTPLGSDSSEREVEVAREQLQRLLAADGPALLQCAEHLAQAIEDGAAAHTAERTLVDLPSDDSERQAPRAPRSQERPRRPPLDLDLATNSGKGATP